MATEKKSNKSAAKPTQVEVRDLKPSRDAKGGGARQQEASFLSQDDPARINAQKKEEESV